MFVRNGFDPKKIYTPQGDFGLLQCLKPCSSEVWDAKPVLDDLLSDLDKEKTQVNSKKVPTCKKCGGPVMGNVRGGDWFIHDHFEAAEKRLDQWIMKTVEDSSKRTLILDIGSGFNTPTVVRFRVERLAYQHPRANFVRINADYPQIAKELSGKSLSFPNYAAAVHSKLKGIHSN
eukprot:TRINITY_DN4351_c0_g1_i1.p1 TRINITY_DN4351_c0_g1~~TRINITY_DN4351_c0_g1_i1.p1  ORF type:complete len:175 (+),score=19.68 TRINITY_DN4351_c0_g1_i1:395-919(+)